MRKNILFVCCLFLLISCKNNTKQNQTHSTQTLTDTSMEESTESQVMGKPEQILPSLKAIYNREDFLSEGTVTFTIQTTAEDENTQRQRFTFTPDLKNIVLENRDGSRLLYAEENTFLYPPSGNFQTSLEELWLPVKIFSSPFHFSTNEENWTPNKNRVLEGESCFTLKNNSEENGILSVFISTETDFIKGILYRENSVEKLVVFDKFFSIGATPFAKEWTFYEWDSAQNKPGNKTGSALLSKVNFLNAPSDFYEIPERALKLN